MPAMLCCFMARPAMDPIVLKTPFPLPYNFSNWVVINSGSLLSQGIHSRSCCGCHILQLSAEICRAMALPQTSTKALLAFQNPPEGLLRHVEVLWFWFILGCQFLLKIFGRDVHMEPSSKRYYNNCSIQPPALLNKWCAIISLWRRLCMQLWQFIPSGSHRVHYLCGEKKELIAKKTQPPWSLIFFCIKKYLPRDQLAYLNTKLMWRKLDNFFLINTIFYYHGICLSLWWWIKLMILKEWEVYRHVLKKKNQSSIRLLGNLESELIQTEFQKISSRLSFLPLIKSHSISL